MVIGPGAEWWRSGWLNVERTGGLAAPLVVGARLVAALGRGRAAASDVSAVGAQPSMSRPDVKRAAFVIMAGNERRLGRRLASPKIVSLTLVKPGQFHPGPVHGAGRTETILWWAVDVRGTLISCGAKTCGIASRGQIAISDATGRELGGYLGGHVTIVPVSSVKQR